LQDKCRTWNIQNFEKGLRSQIKHVPCRNQVAIKRKIELVQLSSKMSLKRTRDGRDSPWVTKNWASHQQVKQEKCEKALEMATKNQDNSN
jgi:hypothetical protein